MNDLNDHQIERLINTIYEPLQLRWRVLFWIEDAWLKVTGSSAPWIPYLCGEKKWPWRR